MSEPEILHRFTLTVPGAMADWAVAEVAECCPEGFEQEDLPEGGTRLICYCLAEGRDSRWEALCGIRNQLGAQAAEAADVALQEETIPNQNWREAWKVHFTLQRIGRFVIRPSWIPYEPAAGEHVIHLDPGSAFGSGLHATTRLCLEALGHLAESGGTFRRVLDFGAGTGILSLGACGLFPCTALAVDDDPLARQATRENAARNHLDDRIQAAPALPEPGAPGTPFDLVLANIQRPVLLAHAAALVAVMAPGAPLVLSGLLVEDAEPILKAYQALGLRRLQVRQQGDWVAVWLARPVGEGEVA